MKNTKLFMFAACTLFLAACGKQTVKIMTPPDASNRVLFSAEQLQSTLDKAGYAFRGKDFQENPCRAVSSFHSLTALRQITFENMCSQRLRHARSGA